MDLATRTFTLHQVALIYQFHAVPYGFSANAGAGTRTIRSEIWTFPRNGLCPESIEVFSRECTVQVSEAFPTAPLLALLSRLF